MSLSGIWGRVSHPASDKTGGSATPIRTVPLSVHNDLPSWPAEAS